MAAPRAVFKRDTGLQTRMLLTLFLMGGLYAAFAFVLFSLGAGVGLMVVFCGGLLLAQLFLSDKIALASMGAKVVTPEQAPGLHAMIEKLCIQADLPKPKIAVADTPVPNAFAMGRSKKSAVVCATTGIMNTLSPTELEGVMAHELSHVKNRDVLIMTMASFFASLASALQHISTAMEKTPERDLRAAENMNAFFIIPARAKSSLKTIFMTHPPTEKRIERLMEYERQLQAAA